MFIGNYAVGFAAKRAAPRASLGTLTGAALLLDFLWAVLVLAGVERVRMDPATPPSRRWRSYGIRSLTVSRRPSAGFSSRWASTGL